MKISQRRYILMLMFSFIAVLPGAVNASYDPQPMITFTFDDVASRVIDNAVPLFTSHQMKGVIYAETLHLDNQEDWTTTYENLKNLQDQQKWEIGSHSITHPDLTQVSQAQLEQELSQSQQSFLNHGIITKSFSTPFGKYDPRVLKAISKYYTSHRAAWGGPNVWNNLYNDYELFVLEVKHDTAPETVMTWIDDAVTHKK